MWTNKFGRTHKNVVAVIGLELATRDSAKVQIVAPILLKHSGIDTITARDITWFSFEFTIWRVGNCYTNSKETFLVFGGKEQVEFAIFFRSIWCPQLLGCPWNVR